jgi:putative ATPase
LVTFIGATTENPSFEVNSALLSRSQVYVLQTLSESELLDLLEKAKKTIFQGISIESSAEQMLVHLADGDARKFLNLLEQADHAAQIKKVKEITEAFLKESLGSHNRRFDKAGDYFYDQISALHKSVRGSNPDAALYWFCRMIDGGADAKYLARRIVRMAWEDIGLADPRAMQLANDAASTYERLGSPEGELALAEALIYLAAAPKSNAAYTAYNQAKAFVANDQTREVPNHLRNAPTQLMKQLGHGHAYRYAHDEPHAYAAGEAYLPEGIDQPNWYQPTDRGLELKIKEKLAFLKSLDEQSKKKS